jgi:signal peptidase
MSYPQYPNGIWPPYGYGPQATAWGAENGAWPCADPQGYAAQQYPPYAAPPDANQAQNPPQNNAYYQPARQEEYGYSEWAAAGQQGYAAPQPAYQTYAAPFAETNQAQNPPQNNPYYPVAQQPDYGYAAWAAQPEPQPASKKKPKKQEKPETPDSPEKAKRKKLFSSLLTLFTYLFCLVMLTGGTLFALSKDPTKDMMGFRFYNVLTPSMVPKFGPGDMIFTRAVQPQDLKIGDIVTFAPSAGAQTYLTHRLVELNNDADGNPETFITKGDANNTNDPQLRVDAIIGKYLFHLPMMGGVITFVQQNLILMSICLVSCLVLLMFLKSYFSVKKEQKAAAEGAPAPDQKNAAQRP